MDTTTNLRSQVDQLRAALPLLGVSDQSFGASLCDQFQRSGRLTANQAPWISKLLARTEPKPVPVATAIGSGIIGVVELLDRAKQHLKHPAVLVRVGDRDMRLSIAGANSKAPGTINVTSLGSFENRTWFGRITREGVFEPSRSSGVDTTATVEALTALAADPAAAAANYGKLTGVCCFCNTKLTDERSTEVGYGPICAKHYGLAWGKAAAQ